MIERVEQVLAIAMSVVGFLTALLTLIRQVLTVRKKQQQAAADERLTELERDVVRLDAVVRRQRRDLQQLSDYVDPDEARPAS